MGALHIEASRRAGEGRRTETRDIRFPVRLLGVPDLGEGRSTRYRTAYLS